MFRDLHNEDPFAQTPLLIKCTGVLGLETEDLSWGALGAVAVFRRMLFVSIRLR